MPVHRKDSQVAPGYPAMTLRDSLWPLWLSFALSERNAKLAPTHAELHATCFVHFSRGVEVQIG
jgi:hypothetical protein